MDRIGPDRPGRNPRRMTLTNTRHPKRRTEPPRGSGPADRNANPDGDGDGLAPPTLREATALIVDDHQLFGDVIRATLEGAGVRVLEVAVTAERGLEAARRHRPELVLVDIGLPDESGLALGRKILEALPETRVVAVTALQDAAAVAESLRLGFQ